MSSEELKPCPFCGSPAMADSGFAPAESIIYAFCSNNDCRLHSVDAGLSPEEWNQRALPDAFQIARHSRRLVEQQRERIAALEAENAALKHRCGMLALGLENAKERQLQAEHQVAILRQHKTDYMDAADGTRKALESECERLADELDRKSVIAGDYIARCQRLAAERDALAAELAAIKGQEPVAFYWQDIGYPEPRKHGPYFGWPSESALRNVDGGAIPVPLYALPHAPRAQEGT